MSTCAPSVFLLQKHLLFVIHPFRQLASVKERFDSVSENTQLVDGLVELALPVRADERLVIAVFQVELGQQLLGVGRREKTACQSIRFPNSLRTAVDGGHLKAHKVCYED